MTLSVAIITFNEEDCLSQALDSIQGISDEIIIVDSGSTDSTKEIAKSYSKVKFFEQEFQGYGLQKQLAVDKCTSKWILSIDADEVVSPELFKSIKNVVTEENNSTKAYSIRRLNYLKGKRIKYGGWNKDLIVRLFTKDSGSYAPLAVHEYWETQEKVVKLSGHLIHSPYKSMWHHIVKLNNYSSAKAKINFERGRRAGYWKIVAAPTFQFIQMYFFRLGFLDGKNGFYLAVLHYYYVFSKYYKLYNLSIKQA